MKVYLKKKKSLESKHWKKKWAVNFLGKTTRYKTATNYFICFISCLFSVRESSLKQYSLSKLFGSVKNWAEFCAKRTIHNQWCDSFKFPLGKICIWNTKIHNIFNIFVAEKKIENITICVIHHTMLIFA